MRTTSWSSLAAATVTLIAGASAQETGQLTDLGTLLGGQKNLTTFYGLIQKYPQILLQLPSTKGVTILAPNNDAFTKIPYSTLNDAFKNNNQGVITNVLEYHILQGTKLAAQLTPGTPVFIPTLLTSPEYTNVTGGQVVQNVEQAGDVVVFVSGLGRRSTLTQADLSFNGGVVQVIDSLLIPPSNLPDTLNAFNLTSLEGALYASEKLPTFNTQPNITIFAPQDSAFQALGPAIANMTAEDLAKIIDYTVLPQTVYSTGLTNGTKFVTTGGESVTVIHSGNNVYINSAQLLTSDILIANGVLHVIDNVLNPQGPDAKPNPALDTQVPAFASASAVDFLPFTSALPCTTACPVTSTSNSLGSTATNAGPKATNTGSSTTHSSSSSKGLGAAMARETGFGAAGLIVALGGAVMMI